jgi:hypothetical protein
MRPYRVLLRGQGVFFAARSSADCITSMAGFDLRQVQAGSRFALMKRNLNGRAAFIAVLEEWPVICSMVVAAGSMIMIGIMLYSDWPQ